MLGLIGFRVWGFGFMEFRVPALGLRAWKFGMSI